MKKYTASSKIICPVQVRGQFNDRRGVFDIVACGKTITGKGESYISQEDAQNKADAAATNAYNTHMRKNH